MYYLCCHLLPTTTHYDDYYLLPLTTTHHHLLLRTITYYCMLFCKALELSGLFRVRVRDSSPNPNPNPNPNQALEQSGLAYVARVRDSSPNPLTLTLTLTRHWSRAASITLRWTLHRTERAQTAPTRRRR